jgi:hypothetical protein
MKKIDFSFSGGFPFTQRTADDLQSATYEFLKAFAAFLQLPDAGNFIISGCIIAGEDITPGYIYMDGDLLKFAGSIAYATTKIKKVTTTENAPFQDGNNNPVYIDKVAQSDPTGIELATFIRVPLYQALTWANLSGIPNGLVIDLMYVHTDNNFTDLLDTKLDGIEDGAEVNVQANWSEANPASDAFIQNKPTILNRLWDGTFMGISDLDGGENYTITIPDVGTTDYYVVGSLVANNPSSWGENNNVTWAITNKQTTSFHLIMKEIGGGSQSLRFDYIIIKKT